MPDTASLIDRLTVQKIGREEIEPHRKAAERAGLSFLDSVNQYGIYDRKTLVGFTGIRRCNGYAIFKNHYVLPEYRRKGVGTFAVRLSLEVARREGFKYAEANCTLMSLPIYMELGATVIRRWKKRAKVRIDIAG
jgi:GNAT superfamily N-acetyltransferase